MLLPLLLSVIQIRTHITYHIYLPLFLIIILLTKLDYCVSLYFTEVVLSITSLKVAWKLAFRICFFQKQQMLDGFSGFSFDSLPFLPR